MSAIENQDRPLDNDPSDPNIGEFSRLKREVKAARRHRSKWREEAQKAYDFRASHQWSEEDQRILDEQHRPTITFNRCAPILNAVSGLEVNNRQGVVYLPRKQGAVGINETYTNISKWVRDECYAEDEESEAFRDLITCGEGWTETRMDYDEDPKGMIVEERIDPLEMDINKGAFRSNYIDARMICRTREMDPEDVRALLNLEDTVMDQALDASSWLGTQDTPEDGGTGNKKDYPEKTREAVKSHFRGELNTVTVVQCQYWKREQVNMVATANDTEPQIMSDEEFEVFKNRAAQMMLMQQPMEYSSVRTTKKVYYECFLGINILGGIRKLEMGRFQFVAMTGFRDRKKKCFYGMLRDMFDPQMWANKWLSQTMNIMNTNAKGGLLAETDAFVNQRKAEKDWADPTKIVFVKPGSLQKQKIKERQPSALPPGLDQLMLFAISSIRDVTGVNLELLGQADREQAASLEAQRRQSAMTVLATMFDGLRRYRKLQGKLMLQFIQLLPDGTLYRVVEQGQYQYVPFIKDENVEQFDTIIDQAPSSPDQKQFIWAVTSQILQMQILPPAAIVELLKYSPYPESVVAEIRKAMGLDGELPPDQLQEKLKQAEAALQFLEQKLQEEQAKSKELQDDKAIEMLKLEIDEYEAQTERLNNQWQARISMADAIAASYDKQSKGEGGTSTGGTSTGGTSMSQPPVGDSEFQELPDLEVNAPDTGQLAALTEKVDQMANMMTQLMQTLGGGGPAPQPQPAPSGM